MTEPPEPPTTSVQREHVITRLFDAPRDLV